jgi:hypothetical protein
MCFDHPPFGAWNVRRLSAMPRALSDASHAGVIFLVISKAWAYGAFTILVFPID